MNVCREDPFLVYGDIISKIEHPSFKLQQSQDSILRILISSLLLLFQMNDKRLSNITERIHIIRDQKVMLDRDLAELYGVEVRAINQAVKRNQDRFPEDFCFKLNSKELAETKSQNVILTSSSSRNYIYPTAFTEQGAYALSFVLRSEQAIKMGIFIARAFTHLRRFVLKNENLMLELKNNDHLSTTFSNFEKRIEQDLIVLYKNSSKFEKRIRAIEQEIKDLKKQSH